MGESGERDLRAGALEFHQRAPTNRAGARTPAGLAKLLV